MNMSFREKSIWISLVVTLLIFGLYFVNAYGVLNDPNADIAELAGLFIGVVVLVVIVEVVLHAALAIVNPEEAGVGKDERDELIELKATRLSYFVLILGVWITVVSTLQTASLLWLANILIFFFILAEIVGFATQLFYYRRGV